MATPTDLIAALQQRPQVNDQLAPLLLALGGQAGQQGLISPAARVAAGGSALPMLPGAPPGGLDQASRDRLQLMLRGLSGPQLGMAGPGL